MCRTSSGRSVSLHRSQHGRCTDVTEKSKVRMLRYLDTSTTTQVPKSRSSIEDPVVPLERNMYRHLLAVYSGKGNSGEFYWNTVWKKFQIGNIVCVNREKGTYMSVYVNEMKLAGKKQIIDPMWKQVDLGAPTSFLDHVYVGVDSTGVRYQAKILWTITKHVRIQDLRRSNRKFT